MIKVTPAGMSTLKFGSDLQISAAGMNMQRRRMKVIAENIANAQATASAPDKNPYRRKMIQVQNKQVPELGVSLVRVGQVLMDTREFPRVFRPGDPGADERGFVRQSNVDIFTEMSDMREANHSYNANLKAYENTRSMMLKALSLLDGR
jgi:flagellar basal-body rod protein FlgC